MPFLYESKAFRLYAAIKNQYRSGKAFILVIILLAGFIAGYCITSIARGTWNTSRLVYSVTAAAICLILAVAGGKLPLWLKTSLVYKIYDNLANKEL
jgi:hypothetical protein